ncbi:hypothetical protein BuS5_02407 [Desulfosarcina sp. BuS5]|nr:hypothetical protein [Desulfosarcina sp. BuS5]WDN89439.1 hypothetical protein BuS5_02407 [Desulfosarcina sp. BuS5]
MSKRHAVVYDVLIEFKFVTLKDAGITGTQAKKLSEKRITRNSPNPAGAG